MDIKIKRLRVNRLYTEGEMIINGMRATFTVEHTTSMLPVGTYTVRIVKRSARKQYIGIFKAEDGHYTGWKIGIGHSYLSSKSDNIICIGTPLIPGAIYKATPDYERITDRLMKCKLRNEPIELIISETNCIQNQPISHWLN